LKIQVEELQEQLLAGATHSTEHHEIQQQGTAVIQTFFDDVPDAMSVSTTSTTSTRSRPHKKNRKNKWHMQSPKKWRRMMRSHRLQSILLTSN
jgi:hypothetical protein